MAAAVPGAVAQPTQKSRRELDIRPKRYPRIKATEGLLSSRAIIKGTKEKYATNPTGEGGKPKLNNTAESDIRYRFLLFMNWSGLISLYYNRI
jgi:hypothetical protein